MIRLPGLPVVFFLCGAILVAYGYHQLAVPPDSSAEVILTRATRGMYSVLAGGAFLMFWLARR